MQAAKKTHLATKLGRFVQLSEREFECLAELQSSPIQVKRGQELTYEGQTEQVAHILQSGWACSFKTLPDGGRQIIAFPVPGDIVGLRSLLLRTADHSFAVLTDAVVTRLTVPRILQVFNEMPHLAVAILWATSRDEAMVVEHLASVGRRNSVERTAHFFLELYDRLRLVGLSRETEFNCPLTQNLLADALGLSTIHVNRVLRQLRERNLLTLKDHKVVIHDLGALAALAGYVIPEINPVVAVGIRARRGTDLD